MSKAKNPKAPAATTAASSSTNSPKPFHHDVMCNGCIIRLLPEIGTGERYKVTLIRTGEARVVVAQLFPDPTAQDAMQRRLITVMNAMEWSYPA
jgi:hypothetical protein